MSRLTQFAIVVAVVIAAAFICGCTDTGNGEVTTPVPTTGPTSVPTTSAEEVKLNVYHAGSLTQPFEELETAFEAEYPNVDVQLKPGGSTNRVKAITELGEKGDVLASADYSLIPTLMMPDYADWYVTFAKNKMVLCYTDESKYADEVTADNWYEILARDDIKWAFSDPNQDPCGYRTPMVIQLAELHYGDDQIFESTIASNSDITVAEENGVWMISVPDPITPDGPLTIRPKSVELVAMLTAGGLDYAWEYRSVAVQNGLKFIELPEAIDLSSVDYADTYAKVKIDVVGGVQTGSPIVYGATVPLNAPNPEYGELFVKMLIDQTGNDIMDGQGQPPIVPAGGYGNVPDMLMSLVTLKS